LLKILASLHTLPDIESYKTRLFRNILPVLKRKTSVHVTWLVYQPDKLNLPPQNDPETTIIDIHDYRNAVEIVQKVKPDIIYGSPTPNLPDHALTLAGKFLNIPVVGEAMNQLIIKSSTMEVTKSFVSAFFERSVPTDTDSRKQFMRRGRFFLFKYLFLLRTQRAIKMNIVKIIHSFFVIIRAHFTALKSDVLYDPYFSCTLNFVESEKLFEQMVNKGFKKSTLITTGIPQYDPVFKRLQNLQQTKNKKIRVLLLTHSLFEHGYHTRKQRDSLVKGIVSEICKYKDEMSLVVKIHPSSEILSEYQALINPIDPDIPIHNKGDVLDFIEESDVVISYSTSASVMQALMLKKPIIFCNFFNLEGDVMLKRGLAYDCKELSSLIPSIRRVMSSNYTTEKIDEFIRDFFYKLDGLASERVCEAIFSLLKNKSFAEKVT